MNDLYVTKRTKFHWKDLKHVINFVDNLTEIAQCMNAGFWMGLIRPMVHTLNKINCVQKPESAGKKSYFNVDAHKLYIYLQRYVTIVFYSTCQQKLPPVAVPRSISRCGRITLVPAKNAKVIARYCISRKNGTIQINKFSLLMAMHPYWKIGDTVPLLLYQGTRGLFLFIDEMPSRRDQATSSG